MKPQTHYLDWICSMGWTVEIQPDGVTISRQGLVGHTRTWNLPFLPPGGITQTGIWRRRGNNEL